MKNTKNSVMIPIDKIRPFEGHPYKVKDDEEMNSLIESLQTQGILSPIIIRPIENTDEYEVISGHRRLHAVGKAGIKEVPALIYAVSRDEAAVMLVDSNLHREHILPSEKAFAYKLKLDAMSRQGFRSDLTSDQVGRKLETADIIAGQVNESKTQIRRYIRLTNLIPELLDLMDEGKIAFSVGVELSYLDDQLQYDLLNEIELNDCTPSYAQSVRMHKAYNAGVLNRDCIKDIMSEQKANQREMFRMPMEQIRKYAPKATEKQLEDFVIKACEHYKKYLQRQCDAR